MQYFSTNRSSAPESFREAVRLGQPPDRGLYFPSEIAPIDWGRLKTLPKAELAFEVIKPYVAGEIDDDSLRAVCRETVDFDFPLVKITENISTLELFHGPTLAFKDVGARFMSRCLRHFARERGEKTVVIVATSGDTGGAVAASFHGVEGTEVVILYPKGKVSRVQELQLTTLGGNVTAIEVDGVFDDCQAMAKRALADEDLKKRAFFTSANSINVARWLPQQFYYFFALQQWADDEPPVISVPSGNFGNICAGILAHAAGLPVRKFIAACNANDVVPRYLRTGEYAPKDSVATLSNAMDVGNPSNFVRIMEIFGQSYEAFRSGVDSVSVSDAVTAETMQRVYRDHGYVLDPHGAVGFYALEKYLEREDGKGFFLETAHPVKFDSVKDILGTFGDVPASVADLESREKSAIEMQPDFEALKEILIAAV